MKTLPNLPTMSEAGLAGYELTGWFAAFVPAWARIVRAANIERG